MHYKNGREAKHGDKVMFVPRNGPPVIGILYDATGWNAPINLSGPIRNLKECLHIDDVLKALPADVPNSTNPEKCS